MSIGSRPQKCGQHLWFCHQEKSQMWFTSIVSWNYESLKTHHQTLLLDIANQLWAALYQTVRSSILTLLVPAAVRRVSTSIRVVY